MTTHSRTQDNLDEFFDFAQLEHDHSTDSAEHVISQNRAFDLAEHMEWTTDTLAPAKTSVPHADEVDNNVHLMESAFDLSQWPMSSGAFSPMPVEQSSSVFSQPSDFSGLLSNMAGLNDNLLLDGHVAPSSSMMEYDDPISLASEDHAAMLATPQLLFEIIPNDTASSTSRSTVRGTEHSRKQSTASSRQPSSTSWKPASAKRKGPQSRIPLEAKQILEDEFAANPYPCSWEMDIIAHQANLEVKKVRNWFNNTRARKAPEKKTSNGIGCSEEAALSRASLDALDKHDTSLPSQPPLAVYLAQAYEEEAVDVSIVQAAAENSTLSSYGDSADDLSDSRQGRRGSIMTSVASSEGTAPTTYTVSSSGSRSNISSFGRDRRRGRRRMAWKDSPHNTRQTFNGVNSAGEPQKDLPFFCTFCPRAFKTKYEWVRHEDSVHALRTTWICCDTRPSALDNCPFCGQAHPDDDHMAGHKYQQCRSKPESQRTFYRRDHFVQHLHHVHFSNAKHPSTRIGCQARLMATEGQNFGCKELALKWRRFGAPMKRDDPMLRCGFCGKKSKDWSERCEHVAEHLIARELDRAVWWSERKENHLENLYSTSPFESFRCRYCLKIFTDIKEMNEHSHCRVWSCRFLKSFDDVAADHTGPPLCPEFPSAKAHHCHLCGAGYRTPHSEHAQNYHRHRSCNQEFYTSEESFLQHLHNFHGASPPGLLQGSSVIEQNFMRNKGASFEPVEFNESWQPCLMDLDTTPIGPFTVEKALATPPTIVERKTPNTSKKQSPARRKPTQHTLDSSSSSSSKPTHRQRTDISSTKLEYTSSNGTKFYRLSTYVPFLSSRIFYAHNITKHNLLSKDTQAVVEELPKPHVASLVMSAGMVSMACVRWAIKPEKRLVDSLVELTLEGTE